MLFDVLVNNSKNHGQFAFWVALFIRIYCFIIAYLYLLPFAPNIILIYYSVNSPTSVEDEFFYFVSLSVWEKIFLREDFWLGYFFAYGC